MNYPCLKTIKDTEGREITVMFYKPRIGVVVETNSPTTKVGYYYENWIPHKFKALKQ